MAREKLKVKVMAFIEGETITNESSSMSDALSFAKTQKNKRSIALVLHLLDDGLCPK